ncbi:TetR/AcrR family transcriptional regulator [Actinomadura sp. WMMA1423]|uniref:TetR/AcrR family transcriptional regulator n=1 Tax=Actinomadura sp. WMMA1423 TaxID=2591108 RepID=UPI001146FB71|nr:TetR/AcrR family transcriptional regulator [Actinomadura sp. WMMA1423]
MNKNRERGRTTRDRILSVATGLFATAGYEATSIETVLRETGISRGSLYHHFSGKEALFWAVMENLGEDVGARLQEAVRDAGDAVATLRAGCLAWIRLAADPAVQQIMLIDAPAVLGWERWRELDEQTLGGIRALLAEAAGQGRIPAELVDTTAHVLLAAVNEIALMISRAEDPEAALTTGEATVTRLVTGMVGA